MNSYKLFSTVLFLIFGLTPSLGATPSTSPGKVYILCYHTFLGKPKIYTDFSISEFKNHIQFLKKNHVNFIQFSDLLHHNFSGDKNVLLVIDDGNISTLQAYQSVLKPLQIKPLLALYPGVINSRKFALTWDQVNQMKTDGCEIASHGFFHEFLTEKFAKAHPDRFRDEFYRSKKDLESHTGLAIHWFVYPFGITSNAAVSTLKQAGYQYAFTIESRPLKGPLSAYNSYLIPRFMITRQTAKQVLQTIAQTPFK